VVVDTPRALRTALDCGVAVETLLVCHGRSDVLPVIDRAAGTGAHVASVDETTLRSLTDVEHPQGLIAIVGFQPRALTTVADADVVVVLDGLGEPGNVGAVVRTAVAVGADAVVTTSGTADPTHPRAVRGSAGAMFAVPMVLDQPAEQVAAALRLAGLPLVVADVAGDPTLPGPFGRFALVVGGEAQGPSPVLRDAADHLVALAMAPPVESLNVAVAAGVLLYSLRSPLR